ncbi:50S ribosomal protein L15 [Halarsenatibacter silvermanii]|uniref:Large ribosomal subunit protein uL15 n=1 Tax=Halarsenatibacter silvermanii TaxID=321763 RepID=A0A1G9NBB3_9FIRM|nr:50S ribosomal protein L15 [Halarsenatibacter silvermanii]SDL83816.1 LSU ribosomal protein L15P [Halarsenatibacter silvermanii]
MKLHNLSPKEGSKRKKQRVGRGSGSGRGAFCGRGVKGQNARSGGNVHPIFEGGQTRLFRRLPKVGFTNQFKRDVSIVNVGQLNRLSSDTEVTPELLEEEGFISKIGKDGVKILGDGELEVALEVKAHDFSESACEKIEAAGGKTEVI